MSVENPEALKKVVSRIKEQFPHVVISDELQARIGRGDLTKAKLFQLLTDSRGKGKPHASGAREREDQPHTKHSGRARKIR